MNRQLRGLAAVGAAGTLSFAGTPSALATERYEDVAGDALGDARDIIAIVIDEHGGSGLSFSVEFAAEPQVDDSGQHLDILWIALDTNPEVTFPNHDGFNMAILGGTQESFDASSQLMEVPDSHWLAADVTLDGQTVTFRVDHDLPEDPDEFHFRVYSAAMHGSLYTEEVDHFPEQEHPPAIYAMETEPE